MKQSNLLEKLMQQRDNAKSEQMRAEIQKKIDAVKNSKVIEK